MNQGTIVLGWTPVRFEDGDTHYEAEPSRNWRLSVGRMLAKGTNRPGNRVRWCVQVRAAKGDFIDADYGGSSSIEAGRDAAETAYRRLQGSPGRPLKGDRPTTSTECSKQRMDRLTATEVAAGEQRQALAGLNKELFEAGYPEWAASVAEISRASALKAVAEYTRRYSAFFLRRGSKMLNAEETSKCQRRIIELAVFMDVLAARAADEPVEYQEFEQVLTELHAAGFYPENSLVSSVAQAFALAEPQSISRAERLRRVVIVCCNFARNLAFYRAGWTELGQTFFSKVHPQAAFWRQANANFLDMCVLEWCKLFGDKKAPHYWGRVVSDPSSFETELLERLGVDRAAFQSEVDSMRKYRDKFIAHLDSLRVMDIPVLDAAQAAVWFYFEYVVTREANSSVLAELPNTADKLTKGYDQCVNEVNEVLRKAVGRECTEPLPRSGSLRR